MLQQFTRNIFSGWGALAVRTAIILIVNPIYIHALGDDRYGIWILAVTVMNYTVLLDFGLRQALIRFVSKFMAEENYDRLNSIVQSAFMVYSLAAVVVILFSATMAFTGMGFFNIPAEIVFEARLLILIVGIDTAINFLFMVWGGAAGAYHRYDLLNGALIAESIVKAVVLVTMLKQGATLIQFAAVFPIFSFLRNLASTIILRRLVPQLKFGMSMISEDSLRLLLKFGSVAFFISLAWIFIDNMDRILIGYFLTPDKITVYSVAFVIIIFMRQFVLAASLPLRPFISHLETKGESATIGKLYLLGTRYLAWAGIAFASGVYIFAGDFILLWMGPGYGEAAAVLKTAAFPFALYFIQAFGVSILYGTENHRKFLYLLIIEASANFILSVILVRQYGLMGIIYGTIIPQIPIYLVVMPRLMHKVISLEPGAYLKKIPMVMFFSALVAMSIGYMLRAVLPPDTWLTFAANVAAVILASLYGGVMILGQKDFGLLRDYYRRNRDSKV